MKYLSQFLIILGFTFTGEALQRLVPLPIPASVYGLLLLFGALCLGIVKLEQVKETGHFLASILPVLFVAPAVKILEYWGIIAPNAGAIIVIVVFTTGAVFGISGLITKWLMRGRGSKDV